MKFIGLKDCFNLKGSPTTHGYLEKNSFTILDPLKSCFIANLDLENLKKQTCSEFCVGSLDFRHNINGLFIGGSSSGAVMNLLKNNSCVSITTDTGNSTIWPAARHNLIGFKPTYGLISRQGLVPLCSYLDTVSLMSSDLLKLKQVFLKILKKDDNDLTQINSLNLGVNLDDNVSQTKLAPTKFKVPKNLFSELQLKEIKKKHPGAQEVFLNVPENFSEILEGFYQYVLCPEFFSNMCKFNGLFQEPQFYKNIKIKFNTKFIKELRTTVFSPEIKSRILYGYYLLKTQAIDQYENNIKSFENFLNSLIGQDYWILPIANRDISKKNSWTPLEGPSWPLIANVLKRPALVFSKNCQTSPYYILGPANTDLNLLNLKV